MSLTAAVVGAVVVLWVLVTIFAHFPPLQYWINRVDQCHLVPRWNFFAPNPGDRDYHLVVRNRCEDGRLTEWRNVPIYVPRPRLACVWHPQKRAAKVLNDAVQSLRFLQRQERVSDSGLPFSLPYLLLLSVASRAAAAPPEAVELQFAIIEATGHDDARPLRCAFLSGYHRR
jgi:hypothetical protein